MNKDVIYIEPDDDITDIITKIESSKERIIALVPPKKAGIFRSIVNIKLITKAGTKAGKNIVLVTTDPSIIKLAAATRLPVTKNLQSAPVIPEMPEEVATEKPKKEELKESSDNQEEKDDTEEKKNDDDDEAKGKSENKNEDGDDKADDDEDEEEDDSDKNGASKKKTDKKRKRELFQSKFKNPALKWMDEHRKILIFGGIGGLLLILVLIWAFVIAPSVVINIGIRTTNNNFSEGVRFTTKLEDENVNEGIFYLTEKKSELKSEVEFEATGSKNVGDKATGTITIYTYFSITGNGGDVVVDAGSLFMKDNLKYVSDSDVTISWDGDLTAIKQNCENSENTKDLKDKGCLVTKSVNVTAENPGTEYNIAAATSGSGWTTNTRVGVASSSAMTGGTDKMATVVQQSDIDKALQSIGTSKEEANRAALISSLDDSSFAIESSFRQTTSDAVSTPAIGEEIQNGQKAKLSVTTTDTIYVLDKTKIEEFITEKAKLAENYKIYTMNDPFIENFVQSDSGYVGKLKTSYVSGPEVTENSVVEAVRGKGIGSAQHDLKDGFSGISSIKIDPSYPWVSTIPDDPNRITVIIDVEE